MKLKLLFKCSSILFLIHSCAAQKNSKDSGMLEGLIGVFEGNCMPSPGVEPCKPTPISTTIFITPPSDVFELVLLIDSVLSDEKGSYKMTLPVGNYSLFLRDGDEIVCRGMRCDEKCSCTPFSIAKDSTTLVNSNLDHASW